MMVEFTLTVLVTGYLIALTHPVQAPKLKDLEGQLLYLKVAELGLIAYSLGIFFMLSVQYVAQKIVQNHYTGNSERFWELFSTINRAETGAEDSLFWAIFTKIFPILLGWLWSRIALSIFNRSNDSWKEKTGNPITELLLYYRLAKESSSSHQLLDSLIDITPLMFFLKGGEIYIGLPILIELCSENSSIPFKELAIFPLFVADQKNFFSESSQLNSPKQVFSPISEDQLFLSYACIERFSICAV